MRYLLMFSFVFSAFHSWSQPKHNVADSGYYVSFDSTKIYYEVKGEGRPVLLVHGFIVDGNSWKGTTLFPDLLANGYKVITLDLRGNGRSGQPQNESAYANDAEAKDIMGLLQYLNIKSYSVAGYSRGSIIVARLLELDKNVHCAVLGGMGDAFTNPDWPRRKMFYEAFSGKPVKELEGVVNYVNQKGLDMQVLAWLQKYQPSTSQSVLKNVKQNILVISGDNDIDSTNTPQALAKLFSSSKLMIVPGDHNHASSTKEFSNAVIAFFKEDCKM
jgi:pimeloyl-ACP methyl ester carboxylesterase